MAVPGALGGDGEEALAPSTPAASGTIFKVAARPAVVGPCWSDLFHPGAPPAPSAHARLRVVADVVGALTQIHGNSGLPREHRRHGRVTPRHVLIGVEGSASLFDVKQPFAKLLPAQPDLGYLAPELLTQSGPPDRRSDVFSVGVMLWEALDNGRLFPHHRAAAISRLIARRALPPPRALEEWAVPLGEVASKALSPNPNDRYQSATELWLALREHLPAPDEARAELAKLAQQALNLSLTAQIRAQPPYLSSPISGAGNDGAPSQAPVSAAALVDADTRYSLPVSSRSLRPQAAQRPTPVSALPPLDWSSLMPPSSHSAPPVPRSIERSSAVPRRAAPPGERPSAVPGDAPSFPSSARQSSTPSDTAASELEYVGLTSGPPSPVAEAYSADDELTQRYEARYRFPPEPSSAQGVRIAEAPIPLISLAPRQDVPERRTAPPGFAALLEAPPQTPLPPESGSAAPRSSPWLAVTLAAVAFVGVGLGAVVFGAGTAFGPLLGLERAPAPSAASAGNAAPPAASEARSSSSGPHGAAPSSSRAMKRAPSASEKAQPGASDEGSSETSQPSASPKGRGSDSGRATEEPAESRAGAEAPDKAAAKSTAPRSPAPIAKKAKRKKPAAAAAPRAEDKAASTAAPRSEAKAADGPKAAAGGATDDATQAAETEAPATEGEGEASEDSAPTSLPFVEEPWSDP